MTMDALVIKMEKITKFYAVGDVVVKALQGIDLMVPSGEFVAIMGASGSGKSTLMNIMGCLDRPTSGNCFFEDVDINVLSRNEYADIRNQKIGFVFQTFNLLPRTSALENVELPLFYDRTDRVIDPKAKAIQALNRVGLGDRIMHKPDQLSGGERQRVAIARALVNQPAIVLADEPTGNLDSLTSVDVMTVFQELNEQGITIVLVTHEPDIAQYAKRIVTLRDGLIIQDNAVKRHRNALDDLKVMQREKKQLQHEEKIQL
jgi:putative ABC transport system ATP-binding protein